MPQAINVLRSLGIVFLLKGGVTFFVFELHEFAAVIRVKVIMLTSNRGEVQLL